MARSLTSGVWRREAAAHKRCSREQGDDDECDVWSTAARGAAPLASAAESARFQVV
jgi:hypothetical protein